VDAKSWLQARHSDCWPVSLRGVDMLFSMGALRARLVWWEGDQPPISADRTMRGVIS
jgi:hypothetical protein